MKQTSDLLSEKTIAEAKKWLKTKEARHEQMKSWPLAQMILGKQ